MDVGSDNQISAEEILREVYEKRKVVKPSTKVEILDLEELKEYQRRKRAEYESYLKRNRLDIGQWIRYAQFEVDQHDIRRARSIFERALLVNQTHVPLWIRYIDTEMKFKYVNHARNILDRAISTLPRVDKLWYKYLLMEESLGHTEIVRALFSKWISLEPTVNAWDAFIDFELRQQNWENVRRVYGKYVAVHPQSSTWLKWINFEKLYGELSTMRSVYSLGVDTLLSFQSNLFKDDAITLILSFADWEAGQQEFERCTALFENSIERWPESKLLKDSLVDFEKKHGNTTSAEESVLGKRKRYYEDRLKTQPRDYDTWWLYLDIIQENFPNEMSIAFENSVATHPAEMTKNIPWKQYICLWVRYLTYVELNLRDLPLCRELYKRLINEVIPHKSFTFSKVWLMYSKFEIRDGNVGTARKLLGKSIGMCPKDKTFKGYIELEIKLKEFDRVRRIYEKYIEFDPTRVETWIKYAELEENLGDEERSRAIYELALDNAFSHFSYSSKSLLMERYIEFENDAEEFSKVRSLYERYIDMDRNLAKVWIDYALYESSSPTDEELATLREAQKSRDMEEDEELEEIEYQTTNENRRNSRKIFERALDHFTEQGDSENRAVVLEAYKSYEEVYGGPKERDGVLKRMPQILVKDRDGICENTYVFPEDVALRPNVSKFVELAKKWKEQQDPDDYK